jgi:dTDP-4-amino-4,6-dideoxygalactose transaminase
MAVQVPLGDLTAQHAAIHDDLLRAMSRVLQSGWFLFGDEHGAFEAEFAAYCGRRHALGVANGTDALELALRAAGCQSGDRVATVANAGGYATTAILAIGSMPSYVDIEQSLTMSPSDLEHLLDHTPGVRAVVVTHLFGQLADMAAIKRVVQGRPVALIEDCAQAHGAASGGLRAGGFGDAAAFSFYPTKNLGALGDGGAVVTDRDDIADRLSKLRQYGWKERYQVELAGGRNSRLDELQAALLRVKLPHLERWNAERRQIAGRLQEAANGTALRFASRAASADYVAHLCVARHSDRDRVRAQLAASGVATAIHYPLLDYQQPGLKPLCPGTWRLVRSEAAQREILTLPCFPGMKDSQIEQVCDAIRSCC